MKPSRATVEPGEVTTVLVAAPSSDRVRVTDPMMRKESHSGWGGFHLVWERKGIWS